MAHVESMLVRFKDMIKLDLGLESSPLQMGKCCIVSRTNDFAVGSISVQLLLLNLDLLHFFKNGKLDLVSGLVDFCSLASIKILYRSIILAYNKMFAQNFHAYNKNLLSVYSVKQCPMLCTQGVCENAHNIETRILIITLFSKNLTSNGKGNLV